MEPTLDRTLVLWTDHNNEPRQQRRSALRFLTGCSMEEAAMLGAVLNFCGRENPVERTLDEWVLASGLDRCEIIPAVHGLEDRGLIEIRGRGILFNTAKFERTVESVRSELNIFDLLVSKTKPAPPPSPTWVRFCLYRALRMSNPRAEDHYNWFARLANA